MVFFSKRILGDLVWGIFSIGEVKNTFLEKRVAKFKQRTLEEQRSKTTIADREQVLIFFTKQNITTE